MAACVGTGISRTRVAELFERQWFAVAGLTLSTRGNLQMVRVDGVLEVEAECLLLRLRSGERRLVVWPHETEILRTPDGALVVHVPATDGRSGDMLRIGAGATLEGGPSGTERLRPQLVSRCPLTVRARRGSPIL